MFCQILDLNVCEFVFRKNIFKLEEHVMFCQILDLNICEFETNRPIFMQKELWSNR